MPLHPVHRFLPDRIVLVLTMAALIWCSDALVARELQLLFLGDQGHHHPDLRFRQLAPVLEKRGVSLTYTDEIEDLNRETLGHFDGLILYANIDTIDDDQAAAVLQFVAEGRGFVPIHCATYCWRNNADMVALMGAQFLKHGGQVFTTQNAATDHPVMRGYGGFTSWDETYIHHQHNAADRTVLEYRLEGDQADGQDREPWTWVRTHGKGRVFYTAWGHDERTWSQPGFHNLIERGIRWACGDDPQLAGDFTSPMTFSAPAMTTPRLDVADFEYVDVGPKIPNYTPGKKWGVQGAPRTMMQRPLPMEESVKHFVTPQGLAVRPWADERSFDAKPIAMNWDERGRLWICETVDYPNELGRNRDRIRICEDTDGDHLADRFTVFAEGLSIPTAIIIVRGGAVVQNGTETIFLKDVDGDDVADQRTVLIRNWALGDTHGGVSNFRYGLDNWIWAMQGYNNSSPEINGRPTQTFRMGFWRFRLSPTDPPQVTDLEFIRSSNNNTWGLGISEDGLIFGSTANHNPSMFVPIPNRYYERVRGWAPSTLGSIADTFRFRPVTDKVRQVDQFGGYTAGAGHALYTARTFPQQWWNRTAFVCGPTGHLVGTFVLRREGAGFTSTSPINLLASDDEWTAPIAAEVGPDGAVWVIDWYNYIVQHNPTPQGFETGRGNAYESELRDKKHGRIYRVVPATGDVDVVHVINDLSQASVAELVASLRHPSFVWRLHAQRLLLERDAQDAAESLRELAMDRAIDAVGLNVGTIHALHTLHGLGQLDLREHPQHGDSIQTLFEACLTHPSPAVRRNAVTLLPADRFGLHRLLDNRQLFSDDDAQVRLHAFLKLSDMGPDKTAGQIVADECHQASDPVMADALTAAAAAHAIPFLAASSTAECSDTAVQAQIPQRVGEHLGRGRPDVRQLERIVRNLQGADSTFLSAVLTGLTQGLPDDLPLKTDAQLDATLQTAFEAASAESRRRLIQLAGRCRSQVLDKWTGELIAQLIHSLDDAATDDADRVQAVSDLVQLRPHDPGLAAQVLDRMGVTVDPQLADSILQTLRLSQAPETAAAIVDAAPSMTPQVRSSAISTLLSRTEWAERLVTGLESRQLDLTDLTLDQKQSLQSYPESSVRDRVATLMSGSGDLPDPDRSAVLAQLMEVTEQRGDVAAGREQFRKHCSKCHVHGDIGKAIGPNLTGMSVHPRAELLGHIIDPSRSVEGNFRLYTVVRRDGRVTSGMLASETRTSLTLIDTEAKETSIQRSDIDELVASRKSLMPEGFEKQMSGGELTDLLEFLVHQGKYVPLSLDRYATAISTRGMFHAGDEGPDRMIFSDWTPKQFRGIPFALTDPRGKRRANIILLHGPRGPVPPKMPKQVRLSCNTSAEAIHLLSGVGGWSYPSHREQTASMTVRLHYADQTTEDHPLRNGVHFADYIRRVDVPGSEFAFSLRNQQIRLVTVTPGRRDEIESLELIKGDDPTAPIVMAITIER